MRDDHGTHGRERFAEAPDSACAELQRRLAADIAALLAAVGRLTQTQADWQSAAGRWSVGEVLHHLVLSNRAFARAVAKLVEQGTAEGLAAQPGARRTWPRLRSIAEVGALGPVRHPDRVTPTPGLPIAALREDLSASHAAVAEQIPRLAGLDLEALRLRHPLGFELNLFHWVDITGAHERRHLRQIEAIMAEPAFPREESQPHE
jgi:hypothetical protein